MAPQGKRMKGLQVHRPFIYGTTAKPFNDTDNPRPAHVPVDHTHSWTVFVRGVDPDTDIFYWLRRVSFKLHESIPNSLRILDSENIMKENHDNSGKAAARNSSNSNKQPERGFVVHETGWGEFEITIKLFFDSRSSEKAQTIYHNLRLHPYGRTEEDKEAMRVNGRGEVKAWTYEEMVFNEPYEEFYKLLTSGVAPPTSGGAGKGKGKGKGATTKGGDERGGGSDVKERSAMIPLTTRPGQPFSRETEQLELKQFREANEKVLAMMNELNKTNKEREAELAALKAVNAA